MRSAKPNGMATRISEHEAVHHRRTQFAHRREKRKIYCGMIPRELLEYFQLPRIDTPQFKALTDFKFAAGSSNVEMALFHKLNFPDPILYGHLTDTVNGQIHILLYVLNDPTAPRFRRGHHAGWSRTQFGTLKRNLESERARSKRVSLRGRYDASENVEAGCDRF